MQAGGYDFLSLPVWSHLEHHDCTLALHLNCDCVQPIDLKRQRGRVGRRGRGLERDDSVAALSRLEHPRGEFDLPINVEGGGKVRRAEC